MVVLCILFIITQLSGLTGFDAAPFDEKLHSEDYQLLILPDIV